MTAPTGPGPDLVPPEPARHDDEPPAGTPWRRSAKALLWRDGRLALLHMHDPVEPALGTWWELPGGGLEAGESREQACAREIAEETGLVVPAGAVGPVLWTRRATFRWLGQRRWQDETVHVVRVPAATPTRPVARTDDEARACLELRWWTLADLQAHPGRCYPGQLPAVAPRLLRGERFDEGFERWS